MWDDVYHGARPDLEPVVCVLTHLGNVMEDFIIDDAVVGFALPQEDKTRVWAHN